MLTVATAQLKFKTGTSIVASVPEYASVWYGTCWVALRGSVAEPRKWEARVPPGCGFAMGMGQENNGRREPKSGSSCMGKEGKVGRGCEWEGT